MHMQGVGQAGTEQRLLPKVKLELMLNVEPSFVLYALLLDPGGCLRARITLFELVEPGQMKKERSGLPYTQLQSLFPCAPGHQSQAVTSIKGSIVVARHGLR